ncbi:PDZ domain-containing protein [Sporosarcina sp. BI001-red]|uniref:PDZ domain-containing protein n=1 Tax=Sporosarcina sp. BI001-red TaxID=2282866 RepID=UPI000E24567C|nr:PDZ domain-containing protein [Sporosarcina sp. BI001-red]REB11182.1 PDZ domain-containing protein [Sporosarcina sp. BI001-red]
MSENWWFDVLRAAAVFFLNPLFWLILLVAVALGYMRVKRERKDFNIRKLPGLTELRRLLADSWVHALILSVLLSGIGLVTDAGWIVLFSIVMVIVLISFYYQWGSPIYTTAIAFFGLVVWQKFGGSFSYHGWSLQDVDLLDQLAITIPIIAGLLLIAEGQLIRKSTVNYASPHLEKTNRGLRAAVFKVKKIWLLPVILLVPGDMISAYVPYWPQFTLGAETFSFVPVPVLIGFSQIARKRFPDELFPKLGVSVIWSGIAVTILGLGALFEPLIGWGALVIGVVIRTVLTIAVAVQERNGGYAASPSARGVVIAGVLPGSPAEKLGLKPGEVIRAVNGMQVANDKELYDAIQVNAAHCRLQVADRNGEVRLMQQVLYRHDHYKLGLLLVR